MSAPTAQEYLQYLSRIIVEAETQNDCLGATREHLAIIAEATDLHEQDAKHFACFIVSLEEAHDEKVEEVVFHTITKDVFTPEEEEGFFGGDNK